MEKTQNIMLKCLVLVSNEIDLSHNGVNSV